MLPMNTVFDPETGKLDWQKPSKDFIPDVSKDLAGAHYQERQEQVLHVIIQGGKTYKLKVAQTLVLELSVMTELTEDEFYDNGNLARNLAALWALTLQNQNDECHQRNSWPKKTASRRAGMGGSGQLQARRDEHESKACQWEILPEIDNNVGANALDEIAQFCIDKSAEIKQTVADGIKELDSKAQVDDAVAIAAPPKTKEEVEEVQTIAEILGVEEMHLARTMKTLSRKSSKRGESTLQNWKLLHPNKLKRKKHSVSTSPE